MWGGPAHLDTFDPKPDAGNDYCGPLEHPHRHQRQRHPHRRAAAAAGQAGRQVFHHPQHDPRHQRARDGVLHRADRARLRRPRRLPQRRRRGLALQGLQRRLQGTHPALHRAHPAAGPLLRGRLPGLALQAVRHRRRPRPGALRRRRRGRAGHHRPAPAGPPRVPAQAQHPGATPCPATRSSPPPKRPRSRPTN